MTNSDRLVVKYETSKHKMLLNNIFNYQKHTQKNSEIISVQINLSYASKPFL